MIELSKIKIDGGTQSREKLDQAVVTEYAEAYKAGATMPAITLFYDGSSYWLADGFHRYFGAVKAGLKQIHEEVTPGTQRDAVLYSLGANAKHGLRRSNADKRRAVLTMLIDAEWAGWSDNAIAKACAVSHTFVSNIRPVTCNVASEKPKERTYTTKHGTTATMDTANVGKKASDKEEAPSNDDAFDETDMVSELSGTVVALADEVTTLKDRLAAGVMDATEEEKGAALETIESLRAEVKRLEIEVKALKDSRDSYMRENGELKKQCAMQRKQLAEMLRAA